MLCGIAALLVGCGGSEPGVYVEFAGGGFVFNYRTANHFYGFVLRQKQPVPDGARFEVRFEVPGGEQVIEEKAISARLQYKFQTGDLEGIKANHPYRVTVRLHDAAGTLLQQLERTFTTEVDQSVLPSKPLVVGPGYEPNPDP